MIAAKDTDRYIIGVEGGGTKTDWIYLRQANGKSSILQEGRLSAANLRLTSDAKLRRMLRLLPRNAHHVGVFLAGCVTAADRKRLYRLASKTWPEAAIAVGSDRDSGFAAAFGDLDGIAVISGTGSAVTGRKGGKIENAGGRGHLLGDRGGAYVISIEGLRLALRNYDLEHRITPLAETILRALSLNRMEDLIGWTQGADKKEISALAPVMFDIAANGDRQMLAVIEAGAAALAQYTKSVAKWLDFTLPPVKLLGSLFLNQPLYADLYRTALKPLMKVASLEICTLSGALGAAHLATSGKFKRENFPALGTSVRIANAASVTEKSNPRSQQIDRLPLSKLIRLFIDEEEHVQKALTAADKSLQKAVVTVVQSFRKNGRLFYVGAGTSGRLGILDASEIPPTFGEPPSRVQGIIAGGQAAITNSVEGAEDDELQGAQSIQERGVCKQDVVCGITASGRTPFVLSALREALRIGAKTILLTCNPDAGNEFGIQILLATGPELITGSTRLKCGTATKAALNILTTCSMIRLGKVRGNQMVDLKPSNTKLKNRAVRIVSELRSWPAEKAAAALKKHRWNIRRAMKED